MLERFSLEARTVVAEMFTSAQPDALLTNVDLFYAIRDVSQGRDLGLETTSTSDGSNVSAARLSVRLRSTLFRANVIREKFHQDWVTTNHLVIALADIHSPVSAKARDLIAQYGVIDDLALVEETPPRQSTTRIESVARPILWAGAPEFDRDAPVD